LFHQGKYSEAMTAYTSALEVMGRAGGAPDAHLTAVLYCNRSACHQGLKRYMDAVLDASHALLHDAQYPRAHQVSGKQNSKHSNRPNPGEPNPTPHGRRVVIPSALNSPQRRPPNWVLLCSAR
jgi:hypothetical protein